MRVRQARIAVDYLTLMCKAHGLPIPQTEYQFCPYRRWRWDYAWPQHRLALEQMGGLWTNGAHVRGARYEEDCRKAAAGVTAGWRVLWASPGQIRRGEAIEWIRLALSQDAPLGLGIRDGIGLVSPDA